jgi:hypothetical protein
MRILHTITLATAITLAASAAGEAYLPQQSNHSANFQDNSRIMGSSGLTVLKLSQMYVEIQEVLDQASVTEQLLLKELAAATEDDQSVRIIRRIERLEADRTLDILKIQARYARLQGRWDLEYQIRARILEVLDQEVYAVK